MQHSILWSTISMKDALITLYSNYEKMEDASQVFQKTNEKNVVTWIAMIAGHDEKGFCYEIIELFFLNTTIRIETKFTNP